jgi:hypothetical protein
VECAEIVLIPRLGIAHPQDVIAPIGPADLDCVIVIVIREIRYLLGQSGSARNLPGDCAQSW